jgi:hypothetical protein
LTPVFITVVNNSLVEQSAIRHLQFHSATVLHDVIRHLNSAINNTFLRHPAKYWDSNLRAGAKITTLTQCPQNT